MADPQISPLKSALRGCSGGIAVVAVFSFAVNLLLLASPLYMLQLFDRVLSSGRIETLIYLTLIAFIALAAMGMLDAIRGRIFARMGRWLDQTLSVDVAAASIKSTLVSGVPSPQPLRDLATVRNIASSSAMHAIFDAPWTPFFIIVIWLLHPYLGILALVSAILLFAVALLNELLSRRFLKEASRLSIVSDQKIETGLRNADAISAMGMLPGMLRSWLKERNPSLELQLMATSRNKSLMGFSKFLRVFVQILVLGGGAYLVLQNQLTPGGMIAASILLSRTLAPVEQAIGSWNSLVTARHAYDRLNTLFESIAAETETMSLPSPRGRVTCENVILMAPGREEPILRGVSFTLEAGEVLGIVGPSAAGKSSLCRVLVGTWKPTRGVSRLDGADIYAWDPLALGRHVGYLPQGVELFAETVKDNIARLAEHPNAEDVVEAATLVGVHDMILQLPHGYDTNIGVDGNQLSAGQRQRVGLARALYGKPKLIVLDEPNSNLDEQGEMALINAIEKAKAWGATVILVGHRPRLMLPVDKMLVLRSGAVETFGPRDEVLAKLRQAQEAAKQRAASAYPQLVETKPPQE